MVNPETSAFTCGDTRRALLSRASGVDEETVESVLKKNLGLVYSIARRFQGRGVEYEDLVQIGSIGLLRAIRTFNASFGNAFSTYAVPLIFGEIRKYLRDDGLIKISRTKKRQAAILFRTREEYLRDHGKEAHLNELCSICQIPLEEAVEALACTQAVHSLSEPVRHSDDADSLEHFIPSESNEIEKETEKMALAESIRKLPQLWQKIILLRYYRNCSQTETASILGLSQVKISREEKKIVEFLREEIS